MKTLTILFTLLFVSSNLVLANDARQEELHGKLLKSIENNELYRVKHIVETLGADVNYTYTQGGMTAIAQASASCHFRIANYLLNRGANPSKVVIERTTFIPTPNYGRTIKPRKYNALYLAVLSSFEKRASCLETVKVLTRKMHDLKKIQVHTALNYVFRKKVANTVYHLTKPESINTDVYSHLINLVPAWKKELLNGKYVHSNVFLLLLRTQNMNLIEDALNTGIEPLKKGAYLCNSNVFKNDELFHMLSDSNLFSLNEVCSAARGFRSRHNLVARSIIENRLDRLEFLLGSEVDINNVTLVGDINALQFAINRKNNEAAKTLVELKPLLVNQKNSYGETAFEWILGTTNEEMINELMPHAILTHKHIYELYKHKKADEDFKLVYRVLSDLLPKLVPLKGLFSLTPLLEVVGTEGGNWEAKSLELVLSNMLKTNANHEIYKLTEKRKDLNLNALRVLINSKHFDKDHQFVVSAYALAKGRAKNSPDHATVAKWLRWAGVDCNYGHLNFCN